MASRSGNHVRILKEALLVKGIQLMVLIMMKTGTQTFAGTVINNTTITVTYDEPLDSPAAATVNNYVIDNGISAVSANRIFPVFDKVNIVLVAPIVPERYSITAATLMIVRAM